MRFFELPGLGDDPAALLPCLLDDYRDTVRRKLAALPATDAQRSRLPSGWTPSELLWHLAHVERRWLQWGFAAEDVDEPWGDADDGRWSVPSDRDLPGILAFHHEQCARSRAIIAGARLDERAAPGGRFTVEEDRPTLAWILLHLLQEYARHTGHLDIACELAGGPTGE